MSTSARHADFSDISMKEREPVSHTASQMSEQKATNNNICR